MFASTFSRRLTAFSLLALAAHSTTPHRSPLLHCDAPPPSPNQEHTRAKQQTQAQLDKQRALAAARRFSSPIFQGTPVAATLLMHQAVKLFDAQFSSLLEMSAIFVLPEDVPDRGAYSNGMADEEDEESLMREEFAYKESGGFFGSWASGVEVTVPVFEKLSETEESRLGNAGIRKKPVGSLVMQGKCSYGCAVVQLMHMQVKKLDGNVVWEKDVSKETAKASAR
ncbi:hypothetical protein HDU98_010969 [Podochytrium sp. JEL0797]|nr:hypothetical protein HDU98_010969 [Podochytrium sp. JEL0797]